jgi:hypothetical protein
MPERRLHRRTDGRRAKKKCAPAIGRGHPARVSSAFPPETEILDKNQERGTAQPARSITWFAALAPTERKTGAPRAIAGKARPGTGAFIVRLSPAPTAAAVCCIILRFTQHISIDCAIGARIPLRRTTFRVEIGASPWRPTGMRRNCPNAMLRTLH